jgi:hypothetical protein
MTGFSKRFALLCLLLPLICLVSCKTKQERQREELERRLAAAVERKRTTNEEVSFYLRDVTDFEWGRVHIFDPYTRHEEINRALGFRWDGAAGTGIDFSDQWYLLVFTSEGRVVNHLMLPINLTYFRDITLRQAHAGFTPDQAFFRTEVVFTVNHPRLVLHPQNQSVSP